MHEVLINYIKYIDHCVFFHSASHHIAVFKRNAWMAVFKLHEWLGLGSETTYIAGRI